MKEIKNVFFLGIGAIGAKYASQFYDKSPENVYVIVDENRKKKYESEGVFVNNKEYKFKYITTPDPNISVDLIILGVKSNNLEESLVFLKPFLQSDTVILSLLNGITTVDKINEGLQTDQALYSIVYMDAVKNGNKITYNHPGKFVFGESFNYSLTQRVLAVQHFFDIYGINYEVPEDMILSLWRKYLINVVGNQLTFILNVGYEGLQDNPYILNLVQLVGEEVIRVANAKNIDLAQIDIDNMIKTMRMLPGKAMTSMHQDRLADRISEVDIFAGEMINIGKEVGVSTPYNNMMYNLIKGYEWERDFRD